MDKRSSFPAGLVVSTLMLAGPGFLHAQSPQISPQHALINQYCVTCHNERAKTARLMLDRIDIDHAGEHTEVWEKVVRKLRGGMMPPQGMPRPDQASIDGLIQWLQISLDQAAGGTSGAGALAPAPAESDRVCECDPRSAGLESGRARPASSR